MSNWKNEASWEYQQLEQALSSMLARVERRQYLAPAMAADGELNNTLHDGLWKAMHLTQKFRAVRDSYISPLRYAQGLATFSEAMPQIVSIIKAVEGARNLSPLFDRMMNREHTELFKLMGQIKRRIESDAEILEKMSPEDARQPDPVMAAWNMMTAPYAVAWGFTMSCMMAWQASLLQHTNSAAKPLPVRLKLVYSRD